MNGSQQYQKKKKSLLLNERLILRTALSRFQDVLKVPEMGFCYSCFICNEETNLLLVNAEKCNWRRVSYKKMSC